MIAHEVAERCADAIAYTLEGGYAVFRDGRRKIFPPCRLIEQRRNERGRCTFARGVYPDGSAIQFKWHPNLGARLQIEAPKAKP